MIGVGNTAQRRVLWLMAHICAATVLTLMLSVKHVRGVAMHRGVLRLMANAYVLCVPRLAYIERSPS